MRYSRKAFRGLVLVALVAAGTVGVQAEEVGPSPRLRLVHLAAGAQPLALPFTATHLGARWHGDEEAVVEVRSATAEGWGAWRALPVAHDLEDPDHGLVYSGLLRLDEGVARLQARVSGDARHLELVPIDGGHRDAAAPASGPPGAPSIITRAGWGADESLRKGPPRHAPVSKLIVHHTVTPNDDPDPAQTVRAIYAFHTRSRGWDDIGYNFLVDAAGRVYEGRWARAYAPGETPTGEDQTGRGVIGAHAQGFNQGSMGFSMLGDFAQDRAPTPAALDGLVAVLAWKASSRNIDPEASDAYTGSNGARSTFPNVAGHRDVGKTACPGGRLYERLPDVRRRVGDSVHGRSPTPAPTTPAPPPPPSPAVPLPDVPGWWAAAPDGRVRAFGDAPPSGDLGGRPLAAPIVALASTAERDGYWLAGGDGGVFAFGNAPFAGSATGRLSAPAVHLEPTRSGRGYWLVSRVGEVLAFGDAGFYGAISPAALPAQLVGAVVGLAPTATDQGYWLAGADGRVFAFGDAVPLSATSGRTANELMGDGPHRRVVAITAAPSGGYWLLGADGGVFAFGAPFYGSVPGRKAQTKAVELRVSEGGKGYYVAGEDGSLFAFGDADPRRERSGHPQDGSVVDIALRPGPS